MDNGPNFTTVEKLMMEQTDLIIDGLKRVNKSIMALHRAISAQHVVDKLASMVSQSALKAVVVRENDGWE